MTDLPHEAALIVGAGPIGLACAISARRRGIDPLVIDAGAVADSIVHYPVGMTFFTTADRLEIGEHPLVTAGQKATREEALKYYGGVARAEQLRVRTYTRLVSASREDGLLRCRLETRLGPEELTTDRLVLATGYFGQPNPLDVPGEHLPHVAHYGAEPHLVRGLDVVIVGGKNSAIESALLYFRAGARVTVVYRRHELRPSVKYWLRPDFENRVKAGEIRALFGATVEAITPADVEVRRADGTTERIPADRVFALTGYHPDFALFDAIGIAYDPTSGRAAMDPATLQSSVPGVYLAGSVSAGYSIGEVFIENGRYDGEKIFGDQAARRHAEELYSGSVRPVGE